MDYDPNGNILTLVRKDNAAATVDSLSYTYGTSNRLQSLTDAAGQTAADWDAESGTFTYDANGNVIQVTEDGANKFSEMLYDSRNLPIFLLKNDSTEIIYQYNSEGQRIFKKVDNQGPEFYIMDGSLNIGVVTGGSLAHWNLLANSVAGRIEGTSKLYYVIDHRGSTRSVLNGSGVVQESYDYYPFGLKMPGRFLNAGTKELFTGKERDTETGLDYFGARYYHPAIGRWWSVEPALNWWSTDQIMKQRLLGISPYGYVRNNPINRLDRDGFEDWSAFAWGFFRCQRLCWIRPVTVVHKLQPRSHVLRGNAIETLRVGQSRRHVRSRQNAGQSR